ncbi:MAG: aminotransferase class V-fold PLP-dependent enzyme [Bacteroidales bacterium]|nr:aminotransferase class V-fold PLP-dependent enzyme [Bacteroidales bacterium]
MEHFNHIRSNIIGIDEKVKNQFGEFPLIYGDWVASGRLYRPIEQRLSEVIGPWVANTHTETCLTGTLMTKAYHESRNIIKRHVNANENDVLLNVGFGMTAAVNKLQRIMGLKYCGKLKNADRCLSTSERPVVFITHMEHHSNHTSWYETVADVVVIPPGKDLKVDLNIMEDTLNKYKDRKLKIGSFSAASNVTGILNPIHEMAEIMHKHGGVAFSDFAAAGPYIDINMHPGKDNYLDGIFFSPHKFLGGPGSSGVLVFNSKLYHNASPDNPGGGTVEWTNPWGEYMYINDIEVREDGGTPGFLQSMRTALCLSLKNEMNPTAIKEKEDILLKKAFAGLERINGIHILADEHRERLGVISFYHEKIHFNLIVKLLNDRFGIQVRGGCACAGTYGHFLLDVSHEKSKHITDLINSGDLSEKPGWVRFSIHPTMTEQEMDYVCDAVKQISQKHSEWSIEYRYDSRKNEFYHKDEPELQDRVEKWLKL